MRGSVIFQHRSVKEENFEEVLDNYLLMRDPSPALPVSLIRKHKLAPASNWNYDLSVVYGEVSTRAIRVHRYCIHIVNLIF